MSNGWQNVHVPASGVTLGKSLNPDMLHFIQLTTIEHA